MSESDQGEVAKWIRWLEFLRRELLTAYVDQELFAELHQAIIESNTSSGLWLDHYLRLYVSKQAMLVRRVVIGDQPSVAVTRLLKDIKHHRLELTASWFSGLLSTRGVMSNFEIEHAEETFATQWCDGGACIAESVVDADRLSVVHQVQAVRRLADRVIAHLHEDGESVRLSWGELKSSIDIVAAVLHRYRGLFLGERWDFPPALPDWHGPFRQALFPIVDSN